MPTMLPVGEWLPDIPPLQNPGALTARNVIPEATSYSPFPQTTNVSNNKLGSRCLGAIVAIDAANNAYDYAGDQSALYSLVSGNSYSNVTRTVGGTYNTASLDGYWEFVQWGQTVIAVNGRTGDVPQQISLGAANFANMTGNPDRAAHIAVVREFVVLGNTSANPQTVQWSAINNANSWTANPATLADSQLLLGDGGFIQRVVGGEYGIIVQEHALYRMTFAGAPLIFQFDMVQRGIGAIQAKSVTNYRNFIFFLAESGFYAFDGSTTTPIGANKVDRFFFKDVDIDQLDRISAVIDPVHKVVAWSYRSTDSTTLNGNCDRILLYNWQQNRWSLVQDVNFELLTITKVLGYTLDGLDAISTNLDSITPSLDSIFWNKGSTLLSAFDNDHRAVAFNGSAMEAVVDTGEVQLFDSKRAMVREVWPVTQGATLNEVTVATITRENVMFSNTTNSSVAVNSTGFAPMRSSARYHRFRITISAGSAFSDIQGVLVDAAPDGTR